MFTFLRCSLLHSSFLLLFIHVVLSVSTWFLISTLNSSIFMQTFTVCFVDSNVIRKVRKTHVYTFIDANYFFAIFIIICIYNTTSSLCELHGHWWSMLNENGTVSLTTHWRRLKILEFWNYINKFVLFSRKICLYDVKCLCLILPTFFTSSNTIDSILLWLHRYSIRQHW